jgi:hypothetical protein
MSSNKTYAHLGPPVPDLLPDSAPLHIAAWSASINPIGLVTATFRGWCCCCENPLTLLIDVRSDNNITLYRLDGKDQRILIPETYNFPGQLIDLAHTKAAELRKTRTQYASR